MNDLFQAHTREGLDCANLARWILASVVVAGLYVPLVVAVLWVLLSSIGWV